MAPPIYFFPKKTLADLLDGEKILRAPLAAVDLDDVLRDVRTKDEASIWELSGKGPGGHSGVLLTALQDNQAPPRLGYFPEFQNWRPWRSGELWVGIDNEHPPTPGDLARRKQLRGYPFEVAAGLVTVPILRSQRNFTTLPQAWSYGSDGQFEESVVDEYRGLWEESAEIWDVVIARKHGAKIERPRGLDLCLKILALNYRYGRQEQNALHWVNSENWIDLLSLAVDLPAVREYQAQTTEEPDEAAQKKTAELAPS
jgi:hypothetical protein